MSREAKSPWIECKVSTGKQRQCVPREGNRRQTPKCRDPFFSRIERVSEQQPTIQHRSSFYDFLFVAAGVIRQNSFSSLHRWSMNGSFLSNSNKRNFNSRYIYIFNSCFYYIDISNIIKFVLQLKSGSSKILYVQLRYTAFSLFYEMK